MPVYMGDNYVTFQNPTDSNKTVLASTDGNLEITRSDSLGHIDFKSNVGEDFDVRIIGNASGGLDMNAGGASLVIDASGRVRHTNKPSFDSSHRTYDSNGYPNTNVLYHNKGSCYNTSTNRFTAPSDGWYEFYMTCLKSAGAVATRLYLRINGVTQYGGRHFRATEGVTYNTNSVGYWTVYMNKGDYAQSYLGAGSIYTSTNEYNYFGGEMIG